MTLDDKIQAFKLDLIKLDKAEIFDKYFIKGSAYVFEISLKSSHLEHEMKKLVAEALGTSTTNVYLVGSSKIGFSVSPMKLFQHIDSKYKNSGRIADRSDLDIAIVSSVLFDRIGREMYNFTNSYRKKWEYNEYHNKQKKKKPNEIILCYKYFEYFTKGWFKLDYKPVGYDFCVEGWNYQKLVNEIRKITNNRQANIAIYSDDFYFRNYHLENIDYLASLEKSELLQNV